MIKVIGHGKCPDTLAAIEELKAKGTEFEFIDMAADPANVKAYLELREKNEIYKPVVAADRLGIPCFIKEDGSACFEL